MIEHLLLLSLVIVAGCTNGKATAQNKNARYFFLRLAR